LVANVLRILPFSCFFVIYLHNLGIIKTDDSMKRASSQAADQGHIHDEEVSQALINLEAEVTAHPDNYQAWIRLGHLYFDTDQPEKAIEAYNRSLELHPGSADLLTDLGVMYRRVGQAEKAVEIFDLAIEKDPSHLPSRFNKGIVLFYDLNDSQGAINSWEALLKIDPEAKAGNGRSVRDFVDSLKNQQNSTE
jgi:cytochrome c-type biogenesis protein CcmH/NrfG